MESPAPAPGGEEALNDGGEGGREEEKDERERREPHLEPILESLGEPGGVWKASLTSLSRISWIY